MLASAIESRFSNAVFGTPPVGMQVGEYHCGGCSLRNLCLPAGLKDAETLRFEAIVDGRNRVAREGVLYRMGDKFQSIYAIKFGHFKTQSVDRNGCIHVTGFHMAGELLGMDAIDGRQYHCNAVALEDSEVCAIPFEEFEELTAEMPALLRGFHRIMSQEMVREQNVMLTLGSMRAEQQFSIFLINLGSRYAGRGYSSTRFQLRMSRDDIANYLGLTVESISRLLRGLTTRGLITVDKREVKILDLEGLRSLAAGNTPCLPM
jgi:CRP/FNR family transcriptional regulator